MADESTGPDSPEKCPFCGSAMEPGQLRGGDLQLVWMKPRPGFWKGLLNLGETVGAAPTGARCTACRRIILKY
jgi:hypothetical protein